jgi:hypothetical protein
VREVALLSKVSNDEFPQPPAGSVMRPRVLSTLSPFEQIRTVKLACCDITIVKPPDFCLRSPQDFGLRHGDRRLDTSVAHHLADHQSSAHRLQISFPSRNMSIEIPASSTPQPHHCAALASRLSLLTQRQHRFSLLAPFNIIPSCAQRGFALSWLLT